ncbi:MAG: ComEC/Rec2 family competence protein [Rhodospirillales bacterium]|nr:MAG: ComEC/Rec2 family competence protein [Rhodospirillales bacterium]
MSLAGSTAPTATAATAAAPARIRAYVAGRLLAERDRWALWIPVALGAGIACYFELPVEPPLWAGPAIALLGVAIAFAAVAGRPLAFAIVAFGLGLGVVTWRTHDVAAPVLPRAYGPAPIEGRVVEVTLLPEGRRVVLDRVALRGVRAEATPARIRLTLPRAGGTFATGDRISIVGNLSPPPGPAAPGAFDFQRFAWYQRLGAVGYAMGQPVVVQRGAPDGVIMRIDELRRRLSARIVAALPGDAGAMAAALIVGDQSGISRETMQALRDSGLAHLLSISGLHISFAAVLVMGLVRYGLALIPRVALRHPIKKWAALAGIAGAGFYTLLAGAPVPAQRSFLMLSIVLLAVLVDRSALTMRLVCWAAAVILVILPESLVGASFQLSFAAVVALIAAWETWRPLRARWRARAAAGGRDTVAARLGTHVAASMFTTIVVSLATAGFSIYHFNRLSLLGVVANLIAVPLTGIWVMPFGLAAMLLMPFGLEGWALAAMGWGIDAIIEVGRQTAAWPAAAAVAPALPGASLWLLTIGGLWLCLWRETWRLFGLAPVVAAFALGLWSRPPDVLVSEDARLVGVRSADGGMMLSSPRIQRFAGETWVRRAGADGPGLWPVGTLSADGRLRCDSLGCLYSRDGRRVAIVNRTEALADDCGAVDAIVSLVPVRRRCPGAVAVVDRFDLWRHGSHALWIDPGGAFRIETARGLRGERPWVPQPEKRPRATTEGAASPFKGRRETAPPPARSGGTAPPAVPAP